MNKKIILIVSVLIMLLLGASLFFILSGKNAAEKKADSFEQTELQLAHPELLIKDIVVGQGQKAEYGSTVVLHYIGRLEDGSVFDSSYDKDRAFKFTLGKGKVIPGWEIGIEGMREGGKRELTIPPQLAYGESGVRNMIPPHSTIIFEIELIEVN